MTSTCCRSTVVATKSMQNASSLTTQNAPMNMMMIIRVVGVVPRGTSIKSDRRRVRGARASMVDSYESSSNNFVRRMEQAWLISQQPRPVACSSCESNGHIECKCCVICAGKGSTCCTDCKGTGFRAKWLGEPPISK
ncbi:hypothetical protein LWI29_029663 [Acer saccharum]|uniref:Uncharacterized protein n=1 Tax=Acer saccharum TaxID=4024 RepID=A0AA39RF90_ACESA|nr:hypothetical protein LWI29_029663 [Acer saccharum]